MTDLNPELIERALWAWIENATEGVTRENVNPRVLELNRHRAAAALSAVADDIRAEALEDAADAMERDDWTHRDDWGVNCAYSLELRDRAAKLRGADQ